MKSLRKGQHDDYLTTAERAWRRPVRVKRLRFMLSEEDWKKVRLK